MLQLRPEKKKFSDHLDREHKFSVGLKIFENLILSWKKHNFSEFTTNLRRHKRVLEKKSINSSARLDIDLLAFFPLSRPRDTITDLFFLNFILFALLFKMDINKASWKNRAFSGNDWLPSGFNCSPKFSFSVFCCTKQNFPKKCSICKQKATFLPKNQFHLWLNTSLLFNFPFDSLNTFHSIA